jgi:hypothetical protein
MRWEAHRVCSERLWVERQKRLVEGDVELACPPAADTGTSLPDTSALADRNTLHPFQVSLKRRKRKHACVPQAPFEFPHFFPSFFPQRLSWGSADIHASPMELARKQEVEDAMTLVSTHEDAEHLVKKVTLLESQHAKAHPAQEVTKEKFRSLSDASVDGVRWLVVSEMEHQEQFKELSLLLVWTTELCLAIVGPSQVRNPSLERMWATTICHIEMVEDLAALQAAVTSATELVY